MGEKILKQLLMSQVTLSILIILVFMLLIVISILCAIKVIEFTKEYNTIVKNTSRVIFLAGLIGIILYGAMLMPKMLEVTTKSLQLIAQ